MNEQPSNTKYIVGIRTLVERTLWADFPVETKNFKIGTVVQQAEVTSLEKAKRKEAELHWLYESGRRHCLVHGRYIFELYRDQFEIFIEKV
jgi:hypothetical protein